MNILKKHSIVVCWGIFIVCVIARIIEYFFIRTDETVLAENFIHKIFGIVILFILLRVTKGKWSDIGFVRTGFASNITKGLLLGIICFIVAYTIECIILYVMNGNVNLCFYASGFSLRCHSHSPFYRYSSLFISEMICIFPYFCPYDIIVREIREFIF